MKGIYHYKNKLFSHPTPLIFFFFSYLKGDLSILEEIVHICQIPYNEGTEEQREKWRRSTPIWAKNSPGITYLSCSS